VTADEAEPLSLFIAHLGIAEEILEAHRGYCLRCSPNRMVKSPCSLRFYATEALALDDQETS
jgi:hypothetical protein